MNKASLRVICVGLAGFTALSLAGIVALGMNPGGHHDTPTVGVQRASAHHARPVRIRIPHLGIDRPVVSLGARGSTMQLPPAAGVGWWSGSVPPGQPGVSVVTGFIRTSTGAPGVFTRLRDLKPRDRICFTLTDGSQTTYVVTSMQAYPAGTLPSNQIFTGASDPVLKLVTTGGALKPGDPNENVVVTSLTEPAQATP
jgi:hypothetical protein